MEHCRDEQVKNRKSLFQSTMHIVSIVKHMLSAYNTAGIVNPKPETLSAYITENACSSTNKTCSSVTIDSPVLLITTHHPPFKHAQSNPVQQPPPSQLTTPLPYTEDPPSIEIFCPVILLLSAKHLTCSAQSSTVANLFNLVF